MTPARVLPLLVLLGVGAIPVAAAVSAAPPYRYTFEEADRGQAIYVARCAACHGGAMEGKDDGMDNARPLVGARFDARWRADPQALYDKVKRSMPQDDPGSLTLDQATAVVATILRANHVAPSS
jgi:mono/diheme cytochrome c family protein